jgi:hypothetical protein
VLPANYVIRHATPGDDQALRDIAALDSQRPLAEPVLIGEIDGNPAAAISLADGRVIADPFVHTETLVQVLPIRARAIDAHRRSPSLVERIRAAIGTVPVARAADREGLTAGSDPDRGLTPSLPLS